MHSIFHIFYCGDLKFHEKYHHSTQAKCINGGFWLTSRVKSNEQFTTNLTVLTLEVYTVHVTVQQYNLGD